MHLRSAMVNVVGSGATVILRFEVMDFDRWRVRSGDLGAAWGARSVTVFRDLEQPNRILALVTWDEPEDAEAVLRSTRTKVRMLDSGVVGVPEISFVTRV